jgi:hypothetical protein
MTIFISIAAYRDPELIPTIEDCIARARWPGDLRFGICRQHGEGEAPPPALDRGRMRLLDVPWRESRGACWARAECMKLWDGEDHFLQLDSHHRFAQDWDALLLDQAERSGPAKPLLTAYLPAYDPAVPTPPTEAPTVMRFDRFTPEGIVLCQFGAIPGWQDRRAPMRARFVSGHFLFAPGSFVAEVPYDPELYFIGEEITLAIRAFTHGYDLFHPDRHIAWHEYTRKLRPKHWDDHLADRGVEMPWHKRDAASLAKVRGFLAHPQAGQFGCGTARSFADYESYAGLDFSRRFASRAARRGDEPAPIRPVLPDPMWTVRVALDTDALGPEALDNPLFWYVGFHDANGIEIARDDAGRAELSGLIAARHGPILIERSFASARPPASWTVWPTDRRGRWLGKIERPVEGEGLRREHA